MRERAWRWGLGAALWQGALLTAQAGPAVETLAAQLSSPDRVVRREAAYQLGKMGAEAKGALPALLHALDDRDDQVWASALAAVAGLGPDAEAAIPALIEDLHSRKSRGQQQTLLRSADALARIGPAAIPRLREALGDADSARRAGAAMALGGMESAAGAAVPELIRSLGDADQAARNEADLALGRIGKIAVVPLTAALADGDPKRRMGAATALALIGPEAATSTPELLRLAESDPDLTARAAALGALAKVGADPARTLSLLLTAVNDPQEALRHAAINALAGNRALRQAAVPALAAQLREADSSRREGAARVLGRIGPDAAEAAPALITATREANGAPVFANALAQLGPAALRALVAEMPAVQKAESAWMAPAFRSFGASAVPLLVTNLHHPSATVRTIAADALGGFGHAAVTATSPLFALVADPDLAVQAAALRALTLLRADRARLEPLLLTALADPAPEVRKAGAAGLVALGKAGVIGLEGLMEILADESDVAGNLAAIPALGALGTPAAPAVQLLTARLANPTLQIATAEALGRIGAPAAAAIPQMIETARKGRSEFRAAAINAFGKMGDAAHALPLIYEGLRDAAPEMRGAAATALARLEPDPEKSVAGITPLASDSDPSVRQRAAAALARFGDRAGAAVPALVAMLDRPRERAAALNALREIGVRTVPELLRALAVQDSKVRIFACESLASLGPEAREAAPRLRELLTSEFPAVRESAQAALAKIEPSAVTP